MVLDFYKRYQEKYGCMPTYELASEELWITTAWIYKTICKFEREWMCKVVKKPYIIWEKTDFEKRIEELERIVKELSEYDGIKERLD